MKNYNLTFLPLFEEDLNQIVDYISLQIKNPMAALQLVDQVYAAIQERLPFFKFGFISQAVSSYESCLWSGLTNKEKNFWTIFTYNPTPFD